MPRWLHLSIATVGNDLMNILDLLIGISAGMSIGYVIRLWQDFREWEEN